MKQKFFFLTGAFLLIVSMLKAQDTHYWTLQFGTRSALLGGAVVGGVKDNTALYYNPGSLGFVDTASVSIDASVYQLEKITIYNAIGNRGDFKGSNIGTIPLLFSGIIRNNNPRLKIAYGFVNTTDFDFKATARLDGYYPIVAESESPGDEEFIAQQTIATSVGEMAPSLGLGYRLSEKLSVGVTGLFTYRSQSFQKVSLSRFFLNDAGNTLVTATSLQYMSYYNIRGQLKLGVAWQYDKMDLGLAFTTPGIRLMGDGTVMADITASNLNYNGTGRIDILANDRQENLKSKFKSPLTVSAGVNFHFSRSTLGFSGEYFGGYEIYDIMRAEPSAFVRPASVYPDLGSENFLRVKTGVRPVLNVSVGYEYRLNESVSFLTSFRTNNSYFDEDLANVVGIKPDLSSWNIYHFTAGSTFRIGRSSIAVGFMTGFGTDKHREQEGNLAEPKESNFLRGATTITKANYNSFGFLLGYSYTFKKS